MTYKVQKLQRDRARDLRNNMTEAEKVLWKALRREQLGVRFRRQVAVGPYIVDFLCHPAKLVIELDGGQHAEAQVYDEKRSRFIEGEGFEVLRFWNNEVLGNIEGVLQVIDQKIGAAAKAPRSTKAPRKRGEGRAKPMPCANSVTHSHSPTDTIALTYDARFLRRKVLQSTQGLRFLVDLPHTTSLNHGDAFQLEDGRLVGVVAAKEDLLEIKGDLTRLAWHIGNRHMPCQIEPERLLIQRDHVIRDMLTKLGAELREVCEGFTPEGGAYGHGRTHSHAH